MIKADIVGNCGKDPEVKDTKAGKPMCRFSVASNTKDKSGEVRTSWVTVLCFDEMAHEVASQISAGSRVHATGRLSLEEYEYEGEKRFSATLLADEVGISLRFASKQKEATEEFASPF
jgi:single-strand DNA-binding protein